MHNSLPVQLRRETKYQYHIIEAHVIQTIYHCSLAFSSVPIFHLVGVHVLVLHWRCVCDLSPISRVKNLLNERSLTLFFAQSEQVNLVVIRTSRRLSITRSNWTGPTMLILPPSYVGFAAFCRSYFSSLDFFYLHFSLSPVLGANLRSVRFDDTKKGNCWV